MLLFLTYQPIIVLIFVSHLMAMLSEPGYIPKGYIYNKNRMPSFFRKFMEYIEL